MPFNYRRNSFAGCGQFQVPNRGTLLKIPLLAGSYWPNRALILFAEDSGDVVSQMITSAMAWCDGYIEPLLVPLNAWLQPPLPLQIKSNKYDSTFAVSPLKKTKKLRF